MKRTERARRGREETKARQRPADTSRFEGLFIAVIALAACIAGIRNAFVFDDVPLVQENVRVHGLGRIGEILSSSYWPPPFAAELYRPVASTLIALEYAASGGDPLLFRLVSYALYVATALLVLGLARRILSRTEALVVAALFAAHPVHVEAVALAVNQGELIVGLIATACTLIYLRRRHAPEGLRLRDWGVLSLLYLIAALTKENAFIIPGLLLAAEFLLVREPDPGSRHHLARGHVALIAVGVVAFSLRFLVLPDNPVGAVPAQALAGGIGSRLLTMLSVVPTWIRLLSWPRDLQLDYSPNEIVASTGFGPIEALGLALVMLWGIGIWISRKRAPVVAFGLAWVGVALFPVSNVLIPTGITLAERTLFLPSIGWLIAAGGVIAVAARRAPSNARRVESALAAVAVILVIAGVIRSANRQRTWRNSYQLWVTASQDAPKSLRIRRARDEAAADIAADFSARAENSPTPWRTEYTLAELLRLMGADSLAAIHLGASLRSHPEQGDVRLELTAALLALGRYSDAEAISATGGAADTGRVLRQLQQIADSARRARLSPGSINVSIPQLLDDARRTR